MNTFLDTVHRSLDAMFAIDGKQRVTVWNQACEDLTGISAVQAIGSPCHEILQGHEPSGRAFCGAICPLNQLAKGGPPPSTFSMRISAKDGEKIQVTVGTMLMPSPDNREWMVVHVMRRGHCKSSAGFFDHDDPGKDSIDEEHQKEMDEHVSRSLCLLSERERQILRLLTNGQSTGAISGHLHISMTTVRNHIQRLMAKMNVHSRIEAVTCANRHHLV
jgi:PAS domain S-box-containing protein